MVRFLRKQRGWTQERLATAAGYTKRLVAKAESSGSLKPDTIEILAETLATSELEVHPEDLTACPKELAVAFMHAYAEYEQEMITHCRHFIAEDLQGLFPGGPQSAPLSGLHDGIDAYDQFCRNFFQVFARVDKRMALDTAVYTTSGNHVVVAYYERLANAHLPLNPEPSHVMLNMTFRCGKLAEVEHLFGDFTFGEVVTLWRENQSEVVDHASHYSPPHPPLAL
ncbi:MAG: helix-turn-helix domain-containing protein [Bythopirellula sp.]